MNPLTPNDLDARVLAASSTARDVAFPKCGAEPGDSCHGTARNSHGKRIAAWSRAKSRADGDPPRVRSILRQCRAASVPAFCKQLGAYVLTRNDDGLSGCDEGDWQLADPDGQVEHDLDGTRDGYQGAPVRVHLRDRKGGDMSEWAADLRIREFPGGTP